jgi:hypothetical protein
MNKLTIMEHIIGFLLCLSLIIFLVFCFFIIGGCVTTEDREMTEYEHNGQYDCVLTAGGGAYCR